MIEPSTSIRGWPGDNLFFCWNLWWVSQCMTGEFSQSSFLCPVSFYPEGVNFIFHTHTWLYGVLYSMMQLVWKVVPGGGDGPNAIFAYNILTLISSVFSGLAIASLCRLYGIRSLVALVTAALLGTFTNFRVFSLYGHLNFIGVEFFLWAVYAFARAVYKGRDEGYAWWMIGGIFTGLCWLNGITLGIFCFLFFVYCVGWALDRGVFAIIFLTLLGCAMLAWPHWAQLGSVYLSGDYFVASYREVRACDFLNMIIPSNYQVYAGPYWRLYREKLGIMSGGEGTAFIGWASFYTAIFSFSLFSFRKWIKSSVVRFWLPVALLGLLFVPGEWLYVAGHRLVPLPLRAMRWVPFFNNLRIPPRFIIFFFVPMALLTGYLVQWILSEKRLKLSLCFFGGWAMLFTMDISYTWLADTKIGKEGLHLPDGIMKEIQVERLSVDDGSVWYIPSSFFHHYEATWYQTEHHRPTVFGTNARLSPKIYLQRMSDAPFLAGMIKGENPSYDHLLEVVPGKEDRQEQLGRFVEDHRVEYIITDNQMMEGATRYIQEHYPDCVLIFEDERYGLFQVRE